MCAGAPVRTESLVQTQSVTGLPLSPGWPALLCRACPPNQGSGFCVFLEKGKQGLLCLCPV